MKVFWRMMKYLKPYIGLTMFVMSMLVLGVAFDLFAPWLLKQVIDVGIAEKNVSKVALFSLLLAGGQLLKSTGSYFQNYSQEKIGQNVVFDLRKQLYRHLQRLPFSYYDKAQTGQIMSRMTGDIEAIKNFFGFAATMIITCSLTFVGTIVIMLCMQWKVTLVSMAFTPVLIFVLYQFNKRIGPAWGEVREQMGRLTTTLQENISGIRVVKAFAREHTEKNKFGKRNEQNFESNMTRAKVESNSFPVMNLCGGMVFLLLIWVGGVYVVKGEMSLGTMVAFQWYAWGLIWPLSMAGWMINLMQQALKASPRVFEILDTPVEIASPETGAVSGDAIHGHVKFDHASFAFAGEEGKDQPSVLSDINLEVFPGEVIAVLGATGSGKSSLLNLISRFYDTTEGAVEIDGTNVKQYSLDELRRKIGIVPQETFLFSATIRDNIAYGKPGATEEQIHEAARKAQIHDFILDMPHGYDTLIGERGVGLSGGQRQRVALARAILMDPPILILDEATASVDTATESAIHEALHEVMQGRTTFIIAQRLSSIQRADRIVVLEDGVIVEQGTHKELYERDGFFRKLFQMQQASAQS